MQSFCEHSDEPSGSINKESRLFFNKLSVNFPKSILNHGVSEWVSEWVSQPASQSASQPVSQSVSQVVLYFTVQVGLDEGE
jgi:hypothetical protein